MIQSDDFDNNYDDFNNDYDDFDNGYDDFDNDYDDFDNDYNYDLSVYSLGSRRPAQLPRNRIRERRLQRKTT